MTDAPAIPAAAIAAADWAAAALAVDPALGGIALAARASPLREDWLARSLALMPGGARRLPVGAGEERIFGGLDLAATLAAGRPVHQAGLVAEIGSGALVLPMAERAGAALAGRLSAAWDSGLGFCLIALDETAEDETTRPPAALMDRLAFWVSLPARPAGEAWFGPEDIAAARLRLAGISQPGDLPEAVAATTLAFGIASLRAPLHTLRTARAVAALMGQDSVTPEAAEVAVGLTLAPRATRVPAAPESEDTPPPPEPEQADPQDGEAETPAQRDRIPTEILLEAARAAIPPDLLARLAAAGALAPRGGAGAGAGEDRKGARRGRPAGTRRGDPRSGARLDLIATLRAAAPWQGVRRAAGGAGDRVIVTQDDFRIRQFREKTEKVVIFCVDASGSAALTRLAETKGAIELMLAEAYVRREQVALIAFRGTEAEILLPPTRSLVQAKRRLAALPGGGGTPLAAGLEAAVTLADQVRRRGQTAHLALMTDGRANIARDGSPGRDAAAEDAGRMARLIRLTNLPTVLIDTAPRPQPPARALAAEMGATYLPMPRADARAISATLQTALAAPGAA